MRRNTRDAYAGGYEDGRTARRWGRTDHGDLLSAADDYAQGYRDGLADRRGAYEESTIADGSDHNYPGAY